MTSAIRRLRFVKIHSLRNQACVAHQCFIADSFFSRLRGLIGTKSLSEGEGLFLSHCNDIHMWFMSIPIDVVFVKKKSDTVFQITSIHPHVKPWKFIPIRDSQADQTLELALHTIERCHLQKGDLLCIA